MKANKLNQEAFGNIIGKKRSVIGSYTRGESHPTLDTLIRIADYFGISMSDLVEKNLSKSKTKAQEKVNNPDVNKIVNHNVNIPEIKKRLTNEPCPKCELNEEKLAYQAELISMLREKVSDKEEIISHLKDMLEMIQKGPDKGKNGHHSSQAS